MQMIFNELSLIENEMDENKVIRIFERFISTYSEAVKKKNGFHRGILTILDLKTLNLESKYNSKCNSNCQHKHKTPLSFQIE